jgi:ATP-dependent DNA ligase
MNTGKNNNLRIGFPELRGSLAALKYPVFVEPKLDGELNMWDGTHLINKYGRLRNDFPAVNNLPNNCCIIGELYVGEGKAGALYELLSQKESDTLNFTAFDILSKNGISLTALALVERREELLDTGAIVIPALMAHNKEEVMEHYKLFVAMGYEGAVAKSIYGAYIEGPCAWVKLKHKDRNNLIVCQVSPTQERIEVIHGNVGVGVKCCNKDKVNIKVGDTVEIEHQGVLASGSLRHPVFIRRVNGTP